MAPAQQAQEAVCDHAQPAMPAHNALVNHGSGGAMGFPSNAPAFPTAPVPSGSQGMLLFCLRGLRVFGAADLHCMACALPIASG